ncbi:MarR family winged helix-turn-helix transcriptional regulator [Paenibacillus sp. HW567]|uniref:MarR family winged helix-turn-helix transcriptional regulator n=1 Tax=Paenibacillus sp. HW567 TaxID=1034769 RepID=UPI00036472C7|nr:MarR family transcriptional regulator [Paenibacillus sp. HW567]
MGIFNRQTQAYITSVFASLDISFSESILLMNLYGNEGINQEALSSLLFIDKAATARSIKSLERKGFIRRETMPEDKRAKQLFLTLKGSEHQDYFYKRLEKWERYVTGGMDEEAKDQVTRGLQMMAEQAMNVDLDEFTTFEEEGYEHAAEPNIE